MNLNELSKEALREKYQQLNSKIEKYQTLFDSMNDLVFISHASNSNQGLPFVEVNQTVCDTLGYSMEEMLTMTAHDIVEDGYTDRYKLMNDLKEDGFSRFEKVLVGKKGDRVYVEVRSTLKNIDGINHIITVARDITEKKHIENERKALIHDMGERIKELTCIYNVERMIRENDDIDYIIKRMITLMPMAWQYPEVTSASISLNGEDYHKCDGQYEDYMMIEPIMINGIAIGYINVCYTEVRPEADEGPFLKEERALLKNLSFMLSGAIERSNDKEAIIAINKDLESKVERRTKDLLMAKNTLSKEHDMLQSYFELANTIILSLDVEGKVLMANRFCCDLLGYSQYEMIGIDWLGECIPSNEQERVQATFMKAIKGEIANFSNFENKIESKNGQIFDISWHNSFLTDKDGMLVSIISIGEDVTKRNKVENELKRAKDQADDASKAKSQFLANMSHEIRTPMNAIVGMSHLLQNTLLTSKQSDYVTKMIRASENLLGVINDILDFSKIEAGREEIENIHFDLFTILHNLKMMMEIRIQEKKVPIDLIFEEPDDGCRYLIGDPIKLTQILTNLMSNAIKFTEEGFVRLDCRCICDDENRVELSFNIADSGIGISKEESSRLFQSFMQADTSTTRKYGGTGLGLAICKKLIEMMDGKIWFESTPGVGSVFHFNVQLMKDVHASRIGTKKVGEHHGQRMSGKHILVVEDNELNQDVISELLRNEGAKVIIADHGAMAVKMIMDNKIKCDLVLMDLHMPVMDGYLATDIIRQQPAYSYLPIIAMTADAASEVESRIYKIGFNDYVTKPIVIEKMWGVIEKWTK